MTLQDIAKSYRHTADMLHIRIVELEAQLQTLPKSERWKVKQRIQSLEDMYNETKHLAIKLEHYYDKTYHLRDKH